MIVKFAVGRCESYLKTMMVRSLAMLMDWAKAGLGVEGYILKIMIIAYFWLSLREMHLDVCKCRTCR